MMETSYYDVLGVSPRATPEAIRRAYRHRARQLHPDRHATAAAVTTGPAGRAMQELNEAWRVLGDPTRRARYDQALEAASAPRRASAFPSTADADDEDARPYSHPLAQPGDLGISIVRALPWVAIVVVLAAIFVFTAFAGENADDASSGSDLVGSCVVFRRGGEVARVPCDGPNDGRVDLLTARSSLCPDGSDVARLAGEESWLCLRDPAVTSGAPPGGAQAPR